MGTRNQRIGSGVHRWMLAVVALGVLAIIAGVWALTLQGQVESLEDDLAAVRANANATRYELPPTETAPESARGQVWLSPSGSGVVTLSNMPTSGDNEVYTLWIETADGSEPIWANTFAMDDAGQGYALIPADMEGITRIGVTLEQRGNQSASGDYLLTTEVTGGNG